MCVCVLSSVIKLEKIVTNNKKNIYRTHILVKEVYTIQTIKNFFYRTYILVKEVCVLVHTIQTIRKISTELTSL